MDKFVRDQPFVLVYVICPWFNGIVTDFANSNRQFYRALARRVFCQYTHSLETAAQYAPKFTGTATLWDLSRDVAAIAFLEDRSILGNSSHKSKVDAFWYLNPNAAHAIRTHVRAALIADLEHEEWEEFANDNY